MNTIRRYWFLGPEDIEQIVHTLASEFFPDYPDPMPVFQYLGGAQGLRLMESALAEPRQTFGGRYLHRTIFDKTAALYRSIIKNHALVDGNKRLGLTASLVFLVLNGYLFGADSTEAVDFTVAVAENRVSDIKQMSSWFRKNSVKLSRITGLSEAQFTERERILVRGISNSQRVLKLLRRLMEDEA